jgi:hypothetical protein
VYLNTSFSDWYLPIFLVHDKETGSPFVCHPHNPKAALRMEELFQLATAVLHINHSECYREWLLKNSLPEECSEKLCVRKRYKRRSHLG